MSRKLQAQLRDLKQTTHAGGASDAVQAETRAKVMQAIAYREEHAAPTPVRKRLSFARFAFGDLLSTPVTAFASIFFLIVGGMTTVSAASSSLPGDTLYGVKLATERAQLQLVSADKRAVLHTEFAERRLEEYLALDSDKRNTYAGPTLEAYRIQVEQATTQVRRLQGQNNAETIAVASELDQKLNALGSVLEKEQGEEQAAAEVAQVSRDAAAEVVDTAIEVHESQPEEQLTRIELESLFKTKIIELTDRQAFNMGRMSVIEARASELELLTEEEISVLNFTIDSATERLGEARRLATSGGFRAAFDILNELKINVSEVESTLADIENQIINFEWPSAEIDAGQEDAPTDDAMSESQSE